MEICVLGSGSSGNCTVLRVAGNTGGRVLLIDAGFGPRTVAKRLAGTGVTLNDVEGVLLTHSDRDHFNPSWFATLARRGIKLFCHERHRFGLYRHRATTACGTDARTLHRNGLLHPFDDQPFRLRLNAPTPADAEADHNLDGPSIAIRPVHLDHDQEGTVGFRIDHAAGRLGYATDLGRVPDRLIEHMADVSLLALESNYDPSTQLASARPEALKRRIMGGKGHLSNAEALDAARAVIDRSDRLPDHLVLLHLSRQCNAPRLVRQTFAAEPRLADRLWITSQTERTPWIRAGDGNDRPPMDGEQMMMFA